jgi:hypothetical protein
MITPVNTLRGPGDWIYNAWQQAQTIPGYDPKLNPYLTLFKKQNIDWGKLLQDYWYIPAIILMAIILLKK